MFATSGVYGTDNLDEGAAILLLCGAVTESLGPESKPINVPKNDPMQTLAWTRVYTAPGGNDFGEAFFTIAAAGRPDSR